MLKNKFTELAFKIVKKDFFYATAYNSEGSPRHGVLRFNNDFFIVERSNKRYQRSNAYSASLNGINWVSPLPLLDVLKKVKDNPWTFNNSYLFTFLDDKFLCELKVGKITMLDEAHRYTAKTFLICEFFEFIGDEEAFKEKAVLMFLST